MKIITIIPLIFCCLHSTLAQKKARIEHDQLIANYLSAIGGKEKWLNLKTRKLKEKYLLYSGSRVEVINQTIPFLKYYTYPNSYLSAHKKGLLWTSIVNTSDCSWIYSGKTENLTFRGSKSILKQGKYPRIDVLEFFNFPVEGPVVDKSGFYVINFQDKYYGRKIAVYFDKTTYLVEKYSYYGGSVLQENYFKDYKTKDGFTEAYRIDNLVDGKKFKTMLKENVEYNVDIDASVYLPPETCSSVFFTKKIEKPVNQNLIY